MRQWCRAGPGAKTRGMPIQEATVTQPELRAADTDRAAVAELLGEALRDGRLTVAEYDDRLAAAYGARTLGDLAPLTGDLPAPVPAPTAAPAGCAAGGQDLGRAWRAWLTVACIVVTVYLASVLGTGDWQYPWPVWVVGPWGAALVARTVSTRGALSRG